MTGTDMATQRVKAKRIEHMLESQGHTVINPFGLGDMLIRYHAMTGQREPSYRDFMECDIAAIYLAATAIYFVDGWTNSPGCMDECDEGMIKKIPMYTEKTWEYFNNKNKCKNICRE